jgi:hypothetical protein
LNAVLRLSSSLKSHAALRRGLTGWMKHAYTEGLDEESIEALFLLPELDWVTNTRLTTAGGFS